MISKDWGKAKECLGVKEFMRQAACVLLASGLLFFINLGHASLWDEDEPKNAECGREMFERGDWIVPTFNYQLRTDKPILLYWLMLSAYKQWGVSEFTARLASACLGTGTVFLTFLIGRRLFGGEAGLWSGLVLTCTLMFCVVSRAATPDATFIFCSTLAFWLFIEGIAAQQKRLTAAGSRSLTPSDGLDVFLQTYLPATPLLWLTWGALGLAVLAKGPAGWLLPSMVIVFFLLWMIRLHESPNGREGPVGTWWQQLWRGCCQLCALPRLRSVASALRPIVWIGIPLAVALPWYLGVGIVTRGAWLTGFLGTHNVGRFLTPMEGHSGPMIYYLAAICLGFFPWTSFLIVAVWDAFSRARKNVTPVWQDIFLLAWIGTYVVFFSFSGTKLPNYVLPCYPALAVLTGRMLDRWACSIPHVSQRTTEILFSGGIGVGLLWLVAISVFAKRSMPDVGPAALAGIIPLVVGMLAFWLIRKRCWHAAITAFSCGGLVFYLAVFGLVVPQVSRFQSSKPVTRMIPSDGGNKPLLGAVNCFTPSLVYYAQNEIQDLPSAQEAARFLRRHPSGMLLIHSSAWKDLSELAPADTTVVSEQPLLLRPGQNVLLVRRNCPTPEAVRNTPLVRRLREESVLR